MRFMSEALSFRACGDVLLFHRKTGSPVPQPVVGIGKLGVSSFAFWQRIVQMIWNEVSGSSGQGSCLTSTLFTIGFDIKGWLLYSITCREAEVQEWGVGRIPLKKMRKRRRQRQGTIKQSKRNSGGRVSWEVTSLVELDRSVGPEIRKLWGSSSVSTRKRLLHITDLRDAGIGFVLFFLIAWPQ